MIGCASGRDMGPATISSAIALNCSAIKASARAPRTAAALLVACGLVSIAFAAQPIHDIPACCATISIAAQVAESNRNEVRPVPVTAADLTLYLSSVLMMLPEINETADYHGT